MKTKFKITAKIAQKVLIALLAIDILLVAIYGLTLLPGTPPFLAWLFDLDRERTLPTAFSALQLFLIGVVFLYSSRWPQQSRIAVPGALIVVGLGFVFLSLDEALAIHERISRTLKPIEWVPMFKGRHGAWIPLYLGAIGALLVAGRRTVGAMFRVYRRQSWIMVAGALVFCFGAVALEILSYQYLRGVDYSPLYKLQVATEELFEMVGASLILYGALGCACPTPEDTSRNASRQHPLTEQT